MGRGFAWLDAGTHGSLLDAGNFVRTITEREGLQVGSPDKVAYRNGWISKDEVRTSVNRYRKSGYGQYLELIAKIEISR